ncbi:hypothetical protein M408DRAFT_78736 [Serendipita vermifera MAFF 305830]|uniref:DUF6532 domain-containing protein n=1 Tax=Serendipita vermifera MAFF 305830 TaxID=933852 RepID=A0A0C3ATU9_SERVB|nr:hypothetical protein M408DRAFT_78736 [Serendipita vermifera MAFF 305830]
MLRQSRGNPSPQFLCQLWHWSSRRYVYISIGILELTCHQVQCALEEWKTGIRMRISFTEEAYARIYREHLKRLERMRHSHARLLGTLLDSLYDHCVARNTVPPVIDHISDDELEDFDILNSDNEDNDRDILEYDVLAPFEA